MSQPRPSSSIRPALRKVPADVLTSHGWLHGTFQVPGHLTFGDYLMLGRQALKLTNVSIPGEPERLPFVALRREAMVIVAPAVAEEADAADAASYTSDLQVACLLPMGMLRGTLRVIYNLRLSDHLQQTGELLTLRRCLLAPYGGTARSPGARDLHTAIVNLSHATGVCESA